MTWKCEYVPTVAIVSGAAILLNCGTGDVTKASSWNSTESNASQGANAAGGASEDDESGGSAILAPFDGCANLECNQVSCGGQAKTTLTGVVRDPRGQIPLYNVSVYIPNGSLSEIAEGASCDQCAGALTGSPLVTAITDTQGRFSLEDVPVGENIPLVIQVGKWRREATVSTIVACQENTVDDDSVRLPRTQSEGHIPKIALTTGGADPLECLLRKIGLSDSEFTSPDGGGRVHLYGGREGSSRFADGYNGGASFPKAQDLWGSLESMRDYDIVLLACEGQQFPETKPPSALQALLDYTSSGGRVFASHWHNYWLEAGPMPLSSTATFDTSAPEPEDPFVTTIDTSFPKGEALADWLYNVGASSEKGKLEIHEARNTVQWINPAVSQQWIYGSEPEAVQYFTFNTPVDAEPEQQCGRMVFSDLHVSSGDTVGVPFPNGCSTTELSPQEKALLFMLFDLSACIQPDDEAPQSLPE